MMKPFTTLFVLLILALGSAAGPPASLHDGRADDPRNASGLHDGRAENPLNASGLHDGRADDPRNVLSAHDFDILDFVAALSAQQAGMANAEQQARMAQTALKDGPALSGKSQAYTMAFDSLHGISLESQAWLHRYRVIYVYDDLMRPIESRDYSRDSEQDGWKPFSRRVLTYNDQGLLSGLTRSLNTLGDGVMYEHLAMEVYYDDSGRLDSLVTHSATDLQVINKTQAELFTYDDAGRPNRIDVLTWDVADARWNQTSYKLITYDEDGKRLESGIYRIGKDKDGHLGTQYEYTYDAEGRLTASVTSHFNYSSLEMEPYSKREYVYDDEGDLTEGHVFVYEKLAWENYSRTEYTYDPTIKYADVASMDFIFELLYDRAGIMQPPNKMLAETASYYYFNGLFNLTNKAVYFVSDRSADSDEQVTGVANLNLVAPALYPNPAGDHITLEWEAPSRERLTLEVYHITGSLVMRREVVSGQQLSIDQLQTGLYLYRLTDGQAIMQSGKLMKR